MFDDLTEEKPRLWQRLRFGRDVAVLLLLAFACAAYVVYMRHIDGQLKRRGEIISARVYATRGKHSVDGGSPTYYYEFTVKGKRFTGWQSEGSASLGPKIGNYVAVTYLPWDPSTNRVGQPFEMAVPRPLTMW